MYFILLLRFSYLLSLKFPEASLVADPLNTPYLNIITYLPFLFTYLLSIITDLPFLFTYVEFLLIDLLLSFDPPFLIILNIFFISTFSYSVFSLSTLLTANTFLLYLNLLSLIFVNVFKY